MSDPLSRKNLPENPTADDILNTPTGSGKSLVALALQFKSLCQGRRSYYTVPIKALANEFGGVRSRISTFPVIAMSLQLQFGEQLLDTEFVVCGHRFQDAAEQGAGFDRAMVWDRDMVHSVHAWNVAKGRECGQIAIYTYPEIFGVPNGRYGLRVFKIRERARLTLRPTSTAPLVTEAELAQSNRRYARPMSMARSPGTRKRGSIL